MLLFASRLNQWNRWMETWWLEPNFFYPWCWTICSQAGKKWAWIVAIPLLIDCVLALISAPRLQPMLRLNICPSHVAHVCSTMCYIALHVCSKFWHVFFHFFPCRGTDSVWSDFVGLLGHSTLGMQLSGRDASRGMQGMWRGLRDTRLLSASLRSPARPSPWLWCCWLWLAAMQWQRRLNAWRCRERYFEDLLVYINLYRF